MKALYAAFFRKLIDVAPHGLRCDGKLLGQFLNGGVTAFVEVFQKIFLSAVCFVHGASPEEIARSIGRETRFGKKKAFRLRYGNRDVKKNTIDILA